MSKPNLHADVERGLFGLFYMTVFANALAYAVCMPLGTGMRSLTH